MRVLAVRQPWASLIAEGLKSIEIRSRHTRIREDIAIYASRTKESVDEDTYVYNVLYKDLGINWRDLPKRPLPHGKILAVASLSGCTSFSKHEFLSTKHQHWNPGWCYQEGKTYGWILKNVRKVAPFEFKFSGSVVWSAIGNEIIELHEVV
ncbi:MAG: ASCH domain-containing protein [Methanomethylovorans sp.]|uniref:ASCH domain-containing protein n=1 Tax=Methanomethylovorans sp. TaxID=2758717 RepID=UPI0035316632